MKQKYQTTARTLTTAAQYQSINIHWYNDPYYKTDSSNSKF